MAVGLAINAVGAVTAQGMRDGMGPGMMCTCLNPCFPDPYHPASSRALSPDRCRIPIPAVQPSSLRINGSYAGALHDPIRSEKSK